MRRRTVLALSTAGAFLLGSMLGGVAPAVAVPVDLCSGATQCTERFEVTRAPETWTVPVGVTSLDMTVAGGAGGGFAVAGGAGGKVTATIAVQAGDELALIVGDAGQSSWAGGAGGYGGGAGAYAAGYGGGGGGGSFVFAENTVGWSPLLVAGGGGGGSFASGLGGDGGFSGGGGDASQDTGNVNHGAGATTIAAGYLNGPRASFDGVTFIPGQGQRGVSNALIGIGGGGGGFYGGAAGTQVPRGGGGGSGFGATGVTVQAQDRNLGAGFIEVTYVNPVSQAQLSVQAQAPVGSILSVTGTVSQPKAGGTGTMIFNVTTPGGPAEAPRTSPFTPSASAPFEASLVEDYVLRAVGTYDFNLTYSGDAIFLSHQAPQMSVAAVPRLVTIDLKTPTTQPETGASTTLVASVLDGEAVPAFAGFPALTGTVDFYDGAALVGSAPVVGGVAQLAWTPQADGTHALEARYGGDPAGYATSTGLIAVTVAKSVPSVPLVPPVLQVPSVPQLPSVPLVPSVPQVPSEPLRPSAPSVSVDSPQAHPKVGPAAKTLATTGAESSHLVGIAAALLIAGGSVFALGRRRAR